MWPRGEFCSISHCDGAVARTRPISPTPFRPRTSGRPSSHNWSQSRHRGSIPPDCSWKGRSPPWRCRSLKLARHSLTDTTATETVETSSSLDQRPLTRTVRTRLIRGVGTLSRLAHGASVGDRSVRRSGLHRGKPERFMSGEQFCEPVFDAVECRPSTCCSNQTACVR